MVDRQGKTEQLVVVVDGGILGLLWRHGVEGSDHIGEGVLISGRKALERVWDVVLLKGDIIAATRDRSALVSSDGRSPLVGPFPP